MPSALQVTVVGKQWWWQFEYPDAKVVTADELVIPDRPRRCTCKLDGVRRHDRRLQRHPQLLGARARGQEGRRARPDQPRSRRGRQARHLPRAVRGVLRAVARQHAVPGDREDARPTSSSGSASSSRARRNPLYEAGRHRRPPGPTQELIVNEVPVHQLPHLRRLVARRPTARTSPTSPAAPRSRAAPTS